MLLLLLSLPLLFDPNSNGDNKGKSNNRCGKFIIFVMLL